MRSARDPVKMNEDDMGTYYRYVNYTRGEFVELTDLWDGGSKESAALSCAPALAWLLVWPHWCGDGYRGRWAPGDRRSPADDVRIVTDGAHDFGDMEDAGYLNITPGLLQSMRTEIPEFTQRYHPRGHDIQLAQRARAGAIFQVCDPVSATCRCGWVTGWISGESREYVLERAVSEHVVNEQDEDEAEAEAGEGRGQSHRLASDPDRT